MIVRWNGDSSCKRKLNSLQPTENQNKIQDGELQEERKRRVQTYNFNC